MKQTELLQLYEDMEERFLIPKEETETCFKMIKALAKCHSDNGFRKDLEHDGWEVLLKKIATYDPNKGSLSRYCRKSINKKMNQITKHYYSESSYEAFDQECHDSGVDSVKDVINKLSIAEFMEKLDKRTRSILKLYYYDGETLKRIADLTGLSQEGVRKIRNKGIALLREEFERQEDGV